MLVLVLVLVVLFVMVMVIIECVVLAFAPRLLPEHGCKPQKFNLFLLSSCVGFTASMGRGAPSFPPVRLARRAL